MLSWRRVGAEAKAVDEEANTAASSGANTRRANLKPEDFPITSPLPQIDRGSGLLARSPQALSHLSLNTHHFGTWQEGQLVCSEDPSAGGYRLARSSAADPQATFNARQPDFCQTGFTSDCTWKSLYRRRPGGWHRSSNAVPSRVGRMRRDPSAAPTADFDQLMYDECRWQRGLLRRLLNDIEADPSIGSYAPAAQHTWDRLEA